MSPEFESARQMLMTDGWAYLNIRHPVCAWATYRGTLVSAPSEPGFVSVWTASMMQTTDSAWISRELALEQHRRQFHPDRVSRLNGMYCFLDLESAEGALRWGDRNSHFRPEYLAELSLAEAGSRRDRLDSNLVTYAPRDESGTFIADDWMDSYWKGNSHPDHSPIWETLVEGHLTVLGSELRQRAYSVARRRFPESLMFLEIARLAAWVGSDLGSICGHLREDGKDFVMEFLMDMRDAESPLFLEKLEKLRGEGHPMNLGDMWPHIARGSFGNVPDLRALGFRRSKAEMPYVGMATPEG